MHEAVEKTVQFSYATLDEALQMASHNPASLLGGGDQFGIDVGPRADLILFRWDDESSSIEIEATIVNGEPVFRRPDQYR